MPWGNGRTPVTPPTFPNLAHGEEYRTSSPIPTDFRNPTARFSPHLFGPGASMVKSHVELHVKFAARNISKIAATIASEIAIYVTSKIIAKITRKIAIRIRCAGWEMSRVSLKFKQNSIFNFPLYDGNILSAACKNFFWSLPGPCMFLTCTLPVPYMTLTWFLHGPYIPDKFLD